MNPLEDDLVDFNYADAFAQEITDDQFASSYNTAYHEPSTSGAGLDSTEDYFGIEDSTLSNIPMDPVYTDSSYQSMSGIHYEEIHMSMEMNQNQPQYNSFEQPVVVNGLDSPFNQYYQNEQPTTSGMHSVQQHQQVQPHQPVMQTMINANQPSRSSNQQIQHQQHQQPQMVMASSAPVLQQQQQPRPQQQRQAPPKSTPKNRPIQPKTASNQNRRRNQNYNSTNNTVGEVLTSANKIAAPAGTAVHLTAESMLQVQALLSDVAALEAQQISQGYDNKDRIDELKKRISTIFLGESQAQNVGAPIINQLKQVCTNGGPQQAPPPPQPTPPARKAATRRTNPSQNSNAGQQQQMLQHQPVQHQQPMPQYSQTNHHQYSGDVQFSQPDSPQYQPNYIHSQPSTSVATGSQIYTADYSPQPIQMEQHNHHQRQQTYRVHVAQQQPMQAIQVTTSYQTPQGPMYVQHGGPPNTQPHYSQTPSGPTVSVTPRNKAKPRHVVLQQQQPIRAVLSPGPIVLSHPPQQQPMQPMQPMRQPITIQPQMVSTPPPPRLPPPRPIRQTGIDATRRCDVRRAQRSDKVKDFMKEFHKAVENPESERPFAGMKDTLMRLLPFHALQEPVLHEEEFNQFDDNYLRHMINMEMDKQRIERRIRGALFKETMNQRDREECNLLLFLDSEYEKRKLAEEKQNVNDSSRAEFVEQSDLLPALKLGAPPITPLVRPKDLDKIHINYDYHTFSDIPRPISPYKSPSPVKSRKNSIRSPSPLKSRSSSKCWSPLKSPTIMPVPNAYGARARTTSTNSSTSVLPSPQANNPKTQKKRITVKEPRNAATKANDVAVPKTEDPIPDNFAMTTVVADIKPVVIKERPERPEIPAKKVERTRKPSSSRISEAKLEAVEVKQEEVKSEPPKMRLPAKKELLSRARNATPLALRSPPAHNSRSSWDVVKKPAVPIENGVDTDGSCSPELGMDDVFDTVPSVSANKAGSSVENASPELVTTEAIMQEKPVVKQKPVPPPIRPKNREPLKAKEPLTTTAKRNADDSANGTVADPPRILFKPQVPRPSSQASSHKAEKIVASNMKKESKLEPVVQFEEKKILATPKVIKFKMFAGVSRTLATVEHKHKRNSKEKKKKKKKRRKRERDKMTDSDSEFESKKIRIHPNNEMIVTPISGTGLKYRFSLTSRTSTPNGDIRSVTPRSEPTKLNSKVVALPQPAPPTPVATIHAPLKLRIKLRRSPSLPQSSPVIVPVSAPTTVPRPVTVSSPHVPLFSDVDSNSEDEHIKATDEAMRNYAIFSQKPVPSGPIVPPSWASNK